MEKHPALSIKLQLAPAAIKCCLNSVMARINHRVSRFYRAALSPTEGMLGSTFSLYLATTTSGVAICFRLSAHNSVKQVKVKKKYAVYTLSL